DYYWQVYDGSDVLF
nr:immunoglobulin light chain junction region [Macaca mulatta]